MWSGRSCSSRRRTTAAAARPVTAWQCSRPCFGRVSRSGHWCRRHLGQRGGQHRARCGAPHRRNTGPGGFPRDLRVAGRAVPLLAAGPIHGQVHRREECDKLPPGPRLPGEGALHPGHSRTHASYCATPPVHASQASLFPARYGHSRTHSDHPAVRSLHTGNPMTAYRHWVLYTCPVLRGGAFGARPDR